MKYFVTFEVYASTVIEVEANSENEARDIANEKCYCPTLCHQCSNDIEVSDIGEIVDIQEAE
jgi:hypothetical protein